MSQIAKALQRTNYLKDLAESIYEVRKAQKLKDLITSLGIDNQANQVSNLNENQLETIAYKLSDINTTPSLTPKIPAQKENENLQYQNTALKKLTDVITSQTPIKDTTQRTVLQPKEQLKPATQPSQIPQTQQFPRGSKLSELAKSEVQNLTKPISETEIPKSQLDLAKGNFSYIEPVQFYNELAKLDTQVMPLLQNVEAKKSEIQNKINLFQNAKTKLQSLNKVYNSPEIETLSNQYDAIIKSLTDKYNSLAIKPINVTGGTIFYDQETGSHVFVPKIEETYYTDAYSGKKYKVMINPQNKTKTQVEIGQEEIPAEEKAKTDKLKELENQLKEFDKEFKSLQDESNKVSSKANAHIESLKSSGVEVKFGYKNFNDLSSGVKIGAKFGDQFYYPEENLALLNRIFGSPENIETGFIKTNILKETVEEPKRLAWSYIGFFDKLGKINEQVAGVSTDLKDYYDYAIRIPNMLFQAPKFRTSQDPMEQAIYKSIFPKGEKEESVDLIPIAEKLLEEVNKKFIQKYGGNDFIKNFQTLMRNYVLGRLYTLQTSRSTITEG